MKPSVQLVYTCIMGSYESFSQPVYPVKEGVKHVLLTDSEELNPDGWQVIKIKPRFPNDSIRSARFLKIMGPALFSEYERSLWLDNTVLLKKAPGDVLNRMLEDSDIAIPYHSYRKSLAGEFGAVASMGYDDFSRIYEQLFHYQHQKPHILEERVYWTGILARKHTNVVIDLMQIWWEQVLRYSRRDQLSLNYALDENPLQARFLDIDTQNSEFHKWPIQTNRFSKKTSANTLVEAISKNATARLAKLEFERPLGTNLGGKKFPKDLYESVLRALYRQNRASIVQVGVIDNEGSGRSIYETTIYQNLKVDSYVIIEPRDVYRDIFEQQDFNKQSVKLITAAIGSGEKYTYYRVAPECIMKTRNANLNGFLGQTASASLDKLVRSVWGGLPKDINLIEHVWSVEVDTKSLSELLDVYEVSNVDVLLLNTPRPLEVIKYCSIRMINPKVVRLRITEASRSAVKTIEAYFSDLGFFSNNYSDDFLLFTKMKIKLS